MISAEFSNPRVRLPQLTGYWITALLNPADGFGSEFYVGVVVDRDARGKLPAVAISPGEQQIGTVRISGDDRDYKFERAELFAVHSIVSRGNRLVAVEFALDFRDSEPPSATLDNSSSAALKTLAALGNDYQIALNGDSAEHLLAAEFTRGRAGRSVYRFATMRNKQNGWLPALVNWDREVRANENARPSIDVKFSQASGTKLTVDRDTADFVHVTERFGVCHDWPIPEVERMRDADLPSARVSPPGLRAAHAIQSEEHAARGVPSLDRHLTTEIATVGFRHGEYGDTALT